MIKTIKVIINILAENNFLKTFIDLYFTFQYTCYRYDGIPSIWKYFDWKLVHIDNNSILFKKSVYDIDIMYMNPETCSAE